MLPEVHINLDRLAIHHIYQVFLPFVPGCTLLIGLLLAHPEFSVLAAVAGLGYYSRLAAVVFVAYAAGLVLYAVSAFFGAALSTSASRLCFTIKRWRPIRDNLVISQNRVWRTVAASFLGNKLPPIPPVLPGSSGLTTASWQFAPHVPQAVLQYDADWNDWYNVLQDYVLRGIPLLHPDTLFLWAIIQATGWALIFVSLQPGLGRHWGVLVVVVPVVLFCALPQFGAVYFYYKYDRLMPADFTARLLAEIRTRKDTSSEDGPPAPQTDETTKV